MLDNQREIARLMLQYKPEDIYFDGLSLTQIKEVVDMHEQLIVFKSLLGFTINVLFDELVKFNNGDDSDDREYQFTKLVVEEVHEDYQHFMILLWNKIPIEEEMNDYILDNINEILGDL